ncbi:MAG: hypothetical protein EZS28_009157 [Streblomastix strix]|uniref:protein-serine/threonine phosphatase n=1 Tax=Streblomastix strix TaxID=222440 RepID=A0A5J4WL17_9EUKA|nr:MAG: hypothetical protein EZS28_009157 [Streblomastix strix]
MKRLTAPEKHRFRDKELKIDLDLSYITPRIIVMGFPAAQNDAISNNFLSDVLKYLDTRHKDHYKIYNLCIERDGQYDGIIFYNRVSNYPFAEHNCPPFVMIDDFCQDVIEKSIEKGKKIFVPHAQKLVLRRVMLAPVPVFERGGCKPNLIIEQDGKQVYNHKEQLGGLERFITDNEFEREKDIEKEIKKGKEEKKKRSQIGDPDDDQDIEEYDIDIDEQEQGQYQFRTIRFEVEEDKSPVRAEKKYDKAVIMDITIQPPSSSQQKYQTKLILSGDVKFIIQQTGNTILSFQINTRFIRTPRVVLKKSECERAYIDTKCIHFSKNFEVSLYFQKLKKEIQTKKIDKEKIIEVKKQDTKEDDETLKSQEYGDGNDDKNDNNSENEDPFDEDDYDIDENGYLINIEQQIQTTDLGIYQEKEKKLDTIREEDGEGKDEFIIEGEGGEKKLSARSKKNEEINNENQKNEQDGKDQNQQGDDNKKAKVDEAGWIDVNKGTNADDEKKSTDSSSQQSDCAFWPIEPETPPAPIKFKGKQYIEIEADCKEEFGPLIEQPWEFTEKDREKQQEKEREKQIEKEKEKWRGKEKDKEKKKKDKEKEKKDKKDNKNDKKNQSKDKVNEKNNKKNKKNRDIEEGNYGDADSNEEQSWEMTDAELSNVEESEREGKHRKHKSAVVKGEKKASHSKVRFASRSDGGSPLLDIENLRNKPGIQKHQLLSFPQTPEDTKRKKKNEEQNQNENQQKNQPDDKNKSPKHGGHHDHHKRGRTTNDFEQVSEKDRAHDHKHHTQAKKSYFQSPMKNDSKNTPEKTNREKNKGGDSIPALPLKATLQFVLPDQDSKNKKKHKNDKKDKSKNDKANRRKRGRSVNEQEDEYDEFGVQINTEKEKGGPLTKRSMKATKKGNERKEYHYSVSSVRGKKAHQDARALKKKHQHQKELMENLGDETKKEKEERKKREKKEKKLKKEKDKEKQMQGKFDVEDDIEGNNQDNTLEKEKDKKAKKKEKEKEKDQKKNKDKDKMKEDKHKKKKDGQQQERVNDLQQASKQKDSRGKAKETDEWPVLSISPTPRQRQDRARGQPT